MRTSLHLAISTAVCAALALLAGGCGTIDDATTQASGSGGAETLLRRFDRGLGRTLVNARPGADLSMSLAVPEDARPGDISWEYDGDKAASGMGQIVKIAAPAAPGASATLMADYADGEDPVVITVRSVPPAELVGWDLEPQGKVFVNDGLPVRGEALTDGANLDTRKGEVAYHVAAGAADREARVQYGGVLFRAGVQTDADGTRVAVAAVRRRAEAPEQVMTASVEHVTDQRFARVLTPDAVAMVKGTSFTVAVSHTDTAVEVTEGAVDLGSGAASPSGGPDLLPAGSSGSIVAQPSSLLDPAAIAAAEVDPDGWEEDEEPLLAAIYGYDTWDDPDEYGFEPDSQSLEDLPTLTGGGTTGLPLAPFVDEDGDGLDDNAAEDPLTYGWYSAPAS